MKKAVFFISSLALCSSSFAGLKELTWHSRANCVNNESITWEAGQSHWLRTFSQHYRRDWWNYTSCFLETKCDTRQNKNCKGFPYNASYELTWRSAAVHWGEAPLKENLWEGVTGSHFIYTPQNEAIKIYETTATNCSIYNGWWD